MLPLILLCLGLTATEETMSNEKTLVKRATPILVVEEIEPSIALWVDVLGFEKTMEVPEDDGLAFVAFQNGTMEVMYQTRRSVEGGIRGEGLPEVFRTAGQKSVLYLEVTDLEALRGRLAGLAGVEILVPSRKTPYGAEELWLREPGGHVVGLAVFEGSPGAE